jgi:TolB-like protein/Tfp pilus assembly protein PilF
MNLDTDTVAETKESPKLKGERQAVNAGSSSPLVSERRRAFSAVVMLAATLALGFGLWNLSRRLAPQITTPASLESNYVASFPEKSIAVLPFADLGAGKPDLLLADSVQDDILTALSKVADLRVISRTSASSYTPDKPRDLREIAESLGAGHILEGTVSSADEKARITVQLTDARRGAKLWTVSYERDLGDVLGMRSDILRRIASQLNATVSPEEKAAIDEHSTSDLAAYAFYVRGKALLASVSSAQVNEKLLQAAQALDQAVARDPNFYLAWCQLAAAHNYIYFFGFDHTPARLALAEAALDTVIRLRPEAGETHLARANFLYRCHLDYDKARAELAHTQRALPNNSEAFELAGYIDRRQGLWSESARSLQRALHLDPRNVFILQQIAASYEELRQFRAMAAALDRALVLAPHDVDTRITRAFAEYEWRADTLPLHHTIDTLLAEKPDSHADFADQWLYLALSERDPAAAARAIAAIPATGTSTDINFPRSFCEGLAAHAAGDAPAAQKAFLAARTEVEKTVRDQPDYGPGYTVLGLIDAALGRKEEAMREGRRALELLPVSKDALDGAEVMKYLGVIYAWCGEKDLAFAQIAATLRIPSTLNYGNLKLRPYWDNLRGDPRFEKIVTGLVPKNTEK